MFEDFVERGGIYFPTTEPAGADSAYRRLWDREAEEDAVYSATGVVSRGREDYHTLTATRQRLWLEFPKIHIGGILEIGCGYGRVPMILSRERAVTCDTYTGLDISRSMLARFVRYREAHDIFSGAELRLVCASAERVPLAEASVDLVISSGVFLHMGKQFVRSTFESIARALRPGGAVVFDTSFPNAYSVGSVPARLYGLLAPDKPNRAKSYTRAELHALMRDTGIATKVGRYVIEPEVFALVPPRLRRFRVPLAERINRLMTPPPRALEDLVAMMFSIRSLIASADARSGTGYVKCLSLPESQPQHLSPSQ
jgi:SAM-dependent methyltransferase